MCDAPCMVLERVLLGFLRGDFGPTSPHNRRALEIEALARSKGRADHTSTCEAHVEHRPSLEHTRREFLRVRMSENEFRTKCTERNFPVHIRMLPAMNCNRRA